MSWTAPSDNGAPIDDYDVRYRSLPGGVWTELTDNGQYTNTRATIPGLTNGTRYDVQVRAENSAGEGRWSPSSRGTPMPPATAPDAPAAPTLTPGDGQLEVSWTAPSDNGAPIDDYDVRYRSGGDWTELSDDSGNTNTRATIGGLTNGTT
ncbi:MAG: fibronectin type III domain-containing protein, partial [Acidobacteria bacterium]|nr:fibronectin type III domain-containing protein [Acidobacteriota bacterium]